MCRTDREEIKVILIAGFFHQINTLNNIIVHAVLIVDKHCEAKQRYASFSIRKKI